ncbi:MAG: glycosyltransferase family 39 protein [Nitrospirae bacterium YQR-1]
MLVNFSGMFLFVPHNDEINYAQYAQLMHRDWENYKYVSMDGSFFGDYKDPLQYWITSLTVSVTDNPVWGVRLCSVIVGFCGFYFAKKLIAEIWTEEAAVFFAYLMLFSAYFFYFNAIAIAEVYMYGFGIAFLYFLWRYMVDGRFYHGILSLLFCLAMTATKESAKAWFAFAVFIPLLICAKGKTFREFLDTLKSKFMIYFGKFFLITTLSVLLTPLWIPSKYAAVKAASNYQSQIRTNTEIFAFPFHDWFGNLKFYFSETLFIDYPWAVLFYFLLVTAGFWFLRKKPLSFLLLVSLWICSFMAAVIYLKPNFMRHFGMCLYFWYFPVAISMALVSEKLKFTKYAVVFWAILILTGLCQTWNNYSSLLKYGQSDISMTETKAHWANGLGVYQMLDKLKSLEAGVLIYDPRWGLPGTVVEIYSKTFPQLSIAPLTVDMLGSLHEIKHKINKENKNMYILVDRGKHGERPWIDAIVTDTTLCSNSDMVQKIYRGKVLDGSSYVICKNKHL